ncbi:MAG TPA: hemerythrin domain-containing protein [Pirellulales bacterium]|jgi:hemerythrin-like domain-containing protein|nr:hemerythrin domain-containing protein [Pirellulales bacterium]
MEHKAISEQMLIEHEMLSHLESALRALLQWTSRGQDLSRKLSSLRFMTESFQRHLEHLMALEEDDGYMEVVRECRPEFTSQVDALRTEHDDFRRRLRRATGRLERLSISDVEHCEQVSQELGQLLEQIDAHSRKEVDLLQRSLLQEEGGLD